MAHNNALAFHQIATDVHSVLSEALCHHDSIVGVEFGIHASF